MTTKPRRVETIAEIRKAVSQLMNAYENLLGLASTYNGTVRAQIIDATGSDPEAVGYKANDFMGNEGLVKADITQAMGTALTALMTFVASSDGKKFEDIRY